MGQRRPRPLQKLFLCIASGGLLALGCNRAEPTTQTPQSVSVQTPTVVSLVPAATDLLVAMGAENHLVGVSNYDNAVATEKLPRVGDYLTTDWERIVVLHPNLLITQYAPGRTPSGFEDHLRSIHATQKNLHIERIADIFTALKQLGEMTDEPDKAAQAARRLQAQLDAVAAQAAKLARVPTLIVVDDQGQNVAGPDTFLNDLLTIAGGQNVMPPGAPAWPAVDRETMLRLSPEVILQLLPGASSQVQSRARSEWDRLTTVAAVKNHRVVMFTGGDVLLPGSHVGDLAEQFFHALHPQAIASSQPAVENAHP